MLETHGPHDDGLEDLLEQIQGSSWERIQSSIGGAGANVLADEGHDTDPSDLAPESRA